MTKFAECSEKIAPVVKNVNDCILVAGPRLLTRSHSDVELSSIGIGAHCKWRGVSISLAERVEQFERIGVECLHLMRLTQDVPCDKEYIVANSEG